MRNFTINKADSGQTAVKYLTRLLKDIPKSLLYKQIRKKNITLNGKKMEGNEKLSAGDVISVFMSEETINKFMGNCNINTDEYEAALEKFKEPSIIYEDEHVILLNKPVGMLSQKSTDKDLSANEWLIGYLLAGKKITKESLANFTPSVCNRLDRNTGGILVFAKTLFGAIRMSECLKLRTLHKYYKTIVYGHVDKETKISGFLVKDEKLNKVTVLKESSDDASHIETAYTPVRYSEANNITELDVELITGKTHQIRAHLASINHPIIGDVKYRTKASNPEFEKALKLSHQLLYAYKIVFPKMEDYEALSEKVFTIDFSEVLDKYFLWR